MKLIKKGAEPRSLKTYRETTKNPVYSATNDIRENLLREQGHICAYCMRRISLRRTEGKGSKPKIEIEHFKSQKRHPKLVLNYQNMLGVCNGNAGKPDHKLCCDKSKSFYDKKDKGEKKGRDLTVDPLDISRISQIKYATDGSIFSEIETINYDLDKMLNLNEPNLKKERVNLYRNLKKRIKDFWAKTNRNKPKVIGLIAKEIEKWKVEDEKGKFKPYCALALYFLRKWHHQYTKS